MEAHNVVGMKREDGQAATVAVVIPAYNQARFLAGSIESVLRQTYPVHEIIVIDDGSSDDPVRVLQPYPFVKFHRQENQGPSAARNNGLRRSTSDYIVFLDADDRLLPQAVATGVACIEQDPRCGLAYGGHRRVTEEGEPIGADIFFPIEGDAHRTLLRKNLIMVPAVGLYRRDSVMDIDGFDVTLRQAEDHDINLRLAEKYLIFSHPDIVAEYRQHGQNVSHDHLGMLKSALSLLDRHQARLSSDVQTRQALREGRENVRERYVPELISSAIRRWRNHRSPYRLLKEFCAAARWSPRVAAQSIARSGSRFFARLFSGQNGAQIQ